jgi:titin
MHPAWFYRTVCLGLLVLAVLFSCTPDFNNPLDPENPNRKAPPPGPGALTATAASQTRINLHWADSSTTEDGFIIERKITGGGYVILDTLPPNDTGYADAGLVSKTIYYYRVTAVNQAGVSTQGAEGSARTWNYPPVLSFTSPDTAGDTSLTIRWNAGDLDDNARISLFYDTDSAGFNGQAVTPAGYFLYSQSALPEYRWNFPDNLARDIRYFIYAAAADSDTTIYTYAPGTIRLPPKPIAISFLTLADQDTVYEVNYRVEFSIRIQGSGLAFVSLNGAGAQAVAGSDSIYSGLVQLDSTSGSQNQIKVKAMDLEGNRDSLTITVYYKKPLAIPAVPAGLQAAAQSVNTIVISWAPANEAASYQVYFSLDSAGGYGFIAEVTGTSYRHTGLTASTRYYYTVRSLNMQGTSVPSAGVSARTDNPPLLAPASPAGLTAQALSSAVIRVTWTAPAYAENYWVYRSLSPAGSYGYIREVTATSFPDSGLIASTAYYYRVIAKNSAGDSPLSDSVFATTQAPAQQAPAKPTGLGAVAVSSSVIQLSWPVAATATSYQIYRSPSATGSYVFLREVAITNYSDSALTASTAYYYKIQAKNNAGSSPSSDSAFATTLAPPLQAPGKPTGIGAAALSSSAIRVNWSAVANADSYQVYRSPGITGTYTLITSLAGTSYDNTGLTALSLYFYKVKAKNSVGESPFSDSTSATTQAPPLQPPAKPTGIGASALSSTAIRVAWSAVANADSYHVYRSLDPSATYNLIFTLPGTIYDDGSLAAATTYYYKVMAKNTAGQSPYSDSAFAATQAPPLQPPAKPSGLGATALSSSVIRLTWPAVATATSYLLYRSPSPAGTYNLISTLSTPGWHDSSLSATTTYYYKIRAQNTAGPSPYSDSAFATTLLAPPAKPIALRATAFSSNSIWVSWAAAADADSYQVYSSSSATGPFALNRTITASSFSHNGLNASTAYYYKIKAKNLAGLSVFSDSAFATTLMALPAKPTGLTATALSNSAIRISWSAAATADSYQVYRSLSGATGTYVFVTALVPTSYDDNGLAASTAYFYKVSAKNSAGESPYSDSAAAATLPPPDVTGPNISNVFPSDRSPVTTRLVNVTITVSDPSGINSVSIGGVSATWTATNDYQASVPLSEGLNTLGITATDNSPSQNQTSLPYSLTYNAPVDTTLPVITITSPASSPWYTNVFTINLTGTATDNVAVTQVGWEDKIGGSGTATGLDHWTVKGVPLVAGNNSVEVYGFDLAGNRGFDRRTIIYDSVPPTGSCIEEGTGVNWGDWLTLDISAYDALSGVDRVTIDGIDGATQTLLIDDWDKYFAAEVWDKAGNRYSFTIHIYAY